MYPKIKLFNTDQFIKMTVCILSVMLIAGCGTKNKEEIFDISGVYQFIPNTSAENTENSTSVQLRGLKIYTDDYYIYAKKGSPDSSSSYEIGTYELEDNIVRHNSIFSSSGTKKYEPKISYYQVKKNKNGVLEIFNNPTGQQMDSKKLERYQYISGDEMSNSPIDGVWKQTASYSVVEKDTTWDPGVNYKIISNGYFVWGSYHDFQTGEFDTYMGGGRSVMNGKNNQVENVLISAWPSVVGLKIPISIEYQNENEFKQTIVDSNTGVKYIEVYRRLNDDSIE